MTWQEHRESSTPVVGVAAHLKWDDIGYEARVWLHGTDPDYPCLSWELFAPCMGETVDDETPPELYGWIKFDGCGHMLCGDAHWIHVCGVEGIYAQAEALHRVWDQAAKMHPHADWSPRL